MRSPDKVTGPDLRENAKECPEGRERLPYGQQRDQEFLLWPLRAVHVTDHGQRSTPAFGLSCSLRFPPPRVAQNVSCGQVQS